MLGTARLLIGMGEQRHGQSKHRVVVGVADVSNDGREVAPTTRLKMWRSLIDGQGRPRWHSIERN